ncbi:DUF2397 family protein [Nocardiopsis kunsanensis]|uniref:DUF2397 family protein n=1 Tax=Nocardiopsis kunsanensis TaxID=141693 RepID=A0A919CGS3_9ACTN|nr:DUF2397 family protein [Nocardiopsis kunsanensis]GHD23444.1 hypothetical protein GCM10007147_18710 [Nocardiopsis kunsanensis]
MDINQWTDSLDDDGTGPGGTPAPRHGRAALLRLAAWFEEAGPDRADALASAVYTLDPARHLHGRVDGTVAATTSWWQAAPDHSTVVERPGNRRPEPVRDHRAQQARLRDAAESSAHWRRDGAEQIRSLLTEPTGEDAQLELTGAGMEVLTELLTAALAVGDADGRPTSAGDLEFGLRLHVLPSAGASVTVSGEGGDLTLQDLGLCVTPYEQVDPGPSEATGAAGQETRPEEEPGVSGPEEPGAGEETGPEEGHAPATGNGPDQEDPTAADEEAPTTGSLPGPEPDIETTGAIDIPAHRDHRQERG